MLIDSIEPEIKIRIYKTYIRPIFTYASPAWVTARTKFCARCQKVQNKFIRWAYHKPRHTNISALHNIASIEIVGDFINKLNSNFIDKLKYNENPLLTDLFNYQELCPRHPKPIRLLHALMPQ